MNNFPDDTPEEIVHLANRALAHIQHRFNVQPDLTSDTLPLIEAFVETVAREENRGEIPEPGHLVRHNMVELFAPSVGAVFGVSLAREFAAKWRGVDKGPRGWRLEFDDFFLRVNPAAMAASAIVRQILPEWEGSLRTAPALTAVLEERLRVAPGVPEEEFFSLSTVWETVQIAADYLRERAAKHGKMDCSADAYAAVLGA
jgi:hypothetical protein